MKKDYCEHCNNFVDDNGICYECQMEAEQMEDMVHSPPHYTNGNGIECIDYIRLVLGEEGFVYFCHGNFIKYQHRYKYKGKPVEDIEKAMFYLERMLKSLKGLHEVHNKNKT